MRLFRVCKRSCLPYLEQNTICQSLYSAFSRPERNGCKKTNRGWTGCLNTTSMCDLLHLLLCATPPHLHLSFTLPTSISVSLAQRLCRSIYTFIHLTTWPSTGNFNHDSGRRPVEADRLELATLNSNHMRLIKRSSEVCGIPSSTIRECKFEV